MADRNPLFAVGELARGLSTAAAAAIAQNQCGTLEKEVAYKSTRVVVSCLLLYIPSLHCQPCDGPTATAASYGGPSPGNSGALEST